MKNKKLKRMVAICLAIAIVMCLSACAGKNGEKQKDNSEAENTFVEDGGNVIPDEKVSIDKNCKVGDYITFGSYEQDNNTSNGKEDIEWLVLDKQDDKILVISKYALDCQPYNEEYEYVTWEDCTLRNWLNNEFINEAFTSKEKSIIPTITVKAEYEEYDNDTQDRVFLLSLSEASEYFSLESSLCEEHVAEPTAYAKAQGADAYCCWWLRSSYSDMVNAASSGLGGRVIAFGHYVNDDGDVVRPAMWINL